MILSKKRNLSGKVIRKLLPHLRLKDSEQRTLELLQQLDEAESHEIRHEALQKLHRSSAYRRNRQQEVEVQTYLSRWTHVIIREMAYLNDFQMDARWIQERLAHPISVPEIEKSLEFLKANGFLEMQRDDRAQPATDKALECDAKVYKHALKEFHRQILEMALVSMEYVNADKRYLSGHTLPIRRSDYPKVLKALSVALDEIQKLSRAHSGDGEEIYHIEVSAIPYTKENV